MAADQIEGGDVMGTVLADFVHIMGDGPVTVNSAAVNQDGFSRPCTTAGIRTDQSVILMFSVRPLDAPQVAQADVYINDKKVGNILNTVHGTFTTQTIIIAKGTDAKFEEDNTFHLRNVPRPFDIKSIICFFHQES
jgi:hypothetical protein